MKSIAAIYKEYGKPSEVLRAESIEIGSPAKGQALVKLTRAVINPSDLGMIGGSYGSLRALPAIAGKEGIGEVIELGPDTESPKVGSIVRIPPEPGVWTQFQICEASELRVLPAGLPPDMLAMSFINPPTALCVLDLFEKLEPGDWAIQNGANSAVGYFFIQMCAARGIKTVNMVRNAEAKRAELEKFGAGAVVDETEFDPKKIKEMTGGNLKLGLNQIGGESVSNMIKAMGNSATVVTIGGMVSDPIRFPTRFLIFNDLRLRGFWWDKYQKLHSPEDIDKIFSKIFSMVSDGTLRAPVDSVWKMEDVEKAVARACENSRNGKVLLEF